MQREPRLLMLVPHEPDLDPRVGWVIDLCRDVARTDVLGSTWSSTKPPVEYDGTLSVERVDYIRYASFAARKIAARASTLDTWGATRRFCERQGRPPADPGLRARLDHHLGALLRLLAAWGFYGLLIDALYRRARAVSVRPTAIVSHDLYALVPAVLLKRRFRARLLHDSHEYFPESDLLAPRWQRRLIRALERRFIKHADVVVTVTPQLAEVFARVYRLDSVIAVPNVEPLRPAPAVVRLDDGKIRFLLQGQASPGRGFEQLFELWRLLEEPSAVLQVRCPDGEYPRELRKRYSDLLDTGRVEWLDAVPEHELVDAAARADVGVIPYVGPSLNHRYACPNKLSQYMAAGLAVLACSDMEFVGEVLRRHDCGTVYDALDAGSLSRAVEVLVEPSRRAELQRNARNGFETDYNWEAASEPYRAALASVLA